MVEGKGLEGDPGTSATLVTFPVLLWRWHIGVFGSRIFTAPCARSQYAYCAWHKRCSNGLNAGWGKGVDGNLPRKDETQGGTSQRGHMPPKPLSRHQARP